LTGFCRYGKYLVFGRTGQESIAVRERIAKSVFWMAWSRVALQGVSFVATIVVVRLLNPADYGLMALAGIWTGVIALLAELGLGAAIVQFQDLSDRELNTCFWLTMGVATLGYGALYVAAPVIAVWFGSPGLSTILRVLGLAVPLVALRTVPDGLLRRRIELDRVSRAEMAAALVTIPVVVGIAWAGFGVWALVGGALATPLVQSAVTFTLARWRPGLQLGGPRVREVLRYSLAMLGTRVGWAAYDQADAFILGKASGDVVLGFYSMAKQLALFPVEKVAGMVNQLATPVMAELQADRQGLRAAFLKGVRLVAWATFPLCIGLALVARDLVEVVLTEKWISAVPVIQVLSMYALIRSVAVLLPPVLMARYRAKFLFGYTAVQLVIMPVAFCGGAVWWGAIGVALAWLTVYPLVLTILARETFRAIDVSLEMIWAQLWPPIAATAVMAASVLVVSGGMSSWRNDLTPARLVLMVSVGAATYGATLLACGGPVRGEIQEAAGWLFRRRRTPTATK
jgi:O-antigen/teichoic acid export membrane protein